jgi:hypothetical protein
MNANDMACLVSGALLGLALVQGIRPVWRPRARQLGPSRPGIEWAEPVVRAPL